MSQHYIDARDPGVTLIVGFDRPLQEFFGQVWRGGEMQADGWVPGVRTVEELQESLSRFGDIPENVRSMLVQESHSFDRDILNRVEDHRSERPLDREEEREL